MTQISPGLREPQIVLPWLVRLRWLAIAGQLTATALAIALAGIAPPLHIIAAVSATTIVSNASLLLMLRSRRELPGWIAPAVILLDVLLLTILLFFTGGPNNPFSTLYLVHVAMAVAVLGTAWTWIIVLATGGLYALLFIRHVPLYAPDSPPPTWVLQVGNWTAIFLVSVLIAYFIGRVRAALRTREIELADAREQAARNEQLATLTTLAAGAAHELGTPLGTIAVVARELEVESARLSADSPMVEDAQLIRQEVDRCRRILDRMRVDSIETIRRSTTPIPVAELIKGVIEDLKHGEESRLIVRADPNLQTVLAPLHTLQQAITVLIRNAFDASPAEVPVELIIERMPGEVVISVVDQGHGMPADIVRRAGQPFFTTKDPGKGMGLGLFLVRLVAERAGGRFVLNSTEGVGTRTQLHLPEPAPAANSE